MSNLDVIWDDLNSRGDWQVTPQGRLSTGNLLRTVVIISLFTDRRLPPNGVPDDRSGDPRGWWHDTFDGTQIGSLLWTLRRRKIANRPQLIAEATAIVNDALAWLVTSGIAATVNTTVTSSGSLLSFTTVITEPTAPPTLVRTLWRPV